MEKREIVIFIFMVSIILLLFIGGIFTFIFQFRKRKLIYENEKKQLDEQHKAELLVTRLEMNQQTMQQIGLEIHDNVGQKLTLANLYTQQLTYENKNLLLNHKIENISNIISESLHDLRQLSKSLTDDSIIYKNINELIQSECDKVNTLKQWNVRFDSQQNILLLSYQVKSILLRIVQEFMQNSIKHANCHNVLVILKVSELALLLSIADDGQGFELANSTNKGIGIANIKKRTAMIGGTCCLTSTIGVGTHLNIEIPLSHL